MKNKLFIFALTLLGARSHAQNSAVTINNNSACDIAVQMWAFDGHGTPGTCNLISRVVNIPPSGSINYVDPCDLETNLGWLTASSSVCPAAGSGFQWENVRILFTGCADCADPVGSRWNGPGSCVPTIGAYPVWHDACREIDWTASGIAPDDITIDVY